MRGLFISSLDKLFGILAIIMVVLLVFFSIAVMFSGGRYGGGFFMGLSVLVTGGVFVLMTGGSMYLGLGIYDNTRKTAELLEKAQNQR